MPPPLAPLEVIERRRRGEPGDALADESFIASWLAGTADDAQMAAWCMAACMGGIDRDRVEVLTRLLLGSGDRLELGRLGPTGDLRSTGGVGGAAILVAAPLAAALGVRVALTGRRAMGHTGGPVDALEAIPGFDAAPALEAFVRQVRDVGIASTACTARLAPGTRRLDGLRDATGTAASAGLAAASVMSAALAGGAGTIAVELPVGAGGLLEAREAPATAALIEALAAPWSRPVRWRVTAMDAPRGRCVGTAMEVGEAAEILRGGGHGDVRDLALAAAADLAEAAGVASAEDCARRAREALGSGAALEAAERWVEAQGADPAIWSDPGLLPRAPVRRELPAPAAGWLAALDARTVGEVARRLGAGRLHPHQTLDPAVGVEVLAGVGDRLEEGRPLLRVHARDDDAAEVAVAALAPAIVVLEDAVVRPPLVLAEGGTGA